ncbi:hypothetical protein [Marimonas arenosa]|uniref:Uncharacterized protein n=1 Tax=Marimonas arenosa TaxID=1795305 RepID=A0AAE4B422_9RHOB|nr:hypothetical protein [Marimonas arenosa]MDQ2088969.1 hypothetical protein [Marimonas arenosa]
MPKAKRSAEKPAETHAIHLSEHSRYQIKSGRLSGEYVARAFPKPPTNARGMIAEARGATEEAAIAALHDLIDAREVRRADDRRADPTTGVAVPSTDEFVEAVAQVALSRPQRAMLTALALADDEGLSAVRVASAAGYKSNASANRALASAGLLIASYLSLEVTPDAAASAHDGILFLGYRGRQRNDEDPGNWILHAELREAVRSAG